MDAELKKYVDGILTCVKYVGTKNGTNYLNKRITKMNDNISRLKHKSRITTHEGQ